MHDSRNNGGELLLFGVIFIILIGSGGIAFLWQRQQALTAQHANALAVAQEAEVALLKQQEALVLNSEQNAATLQSAIRQVLQTQQQAWNDGDIDLFMESYWKSNDLTFSSGGKVTRGWQATLDSYKKRYSTRSAMGKLQFDKLEISSLGPDAALVLGDWLLIREPENIGGKFTLIFRRIQGRWAITHDHTSKAELP